MYKIEYNNLIASDTFEMKLLGDTSKITRSGQFINILLDQADMYLRRPISIKDYDNKSLIITYKVVGKGTKYLSELTKGFELDCLVGLGNGFDITGLENKKVLVVGGGIGTPPLYNLAKELTKITNNFDVVLGFNSKDDVIYEDEFSKLANVSVTTADGSYGTKGYVTNVIDESKYDYYFTCGPTPMLHALYNLKLEGQLSFEERFGCGFGACMGCSHKVKGGSYKRICKEGPVLRSSEVLYE